MSTSQDTSQGTCDGCRSLSFEELNRGVIHHRPASFVRRAFEGGNGCPLCVLIWATIKDCSCRANLAIASPGSANDKRVIRLQCDKHLPAGLIGDVHVTCGQVRARKVRYGRHDGDRSQSSLAAYRLSKLNQARSPLGVGIDRLRHKCEGVFSLRAVPGMDLSR